MQELEDIEENSDSSPEPHFLDKEDMDAESIQAEEKKSLKWAIQQLHKEDINLKKKLDASQQVKDLEDALSSMGSDNEKANAILEEAKSRLSALSIEEEDEEPLTLSQMAEKQRSIQHKIKTASERLRKLEGREEEKSISKELENETIHDNSSAEELPENPIDSSINEEIDQARNEKSSDTKESENIKEPGDENLRPEQKTVAQKGLPVVKDVGEGILQPAKPLDTVAVKGIKQEDQETDAVSDENIQNESDTKGTEEVESVTQLSKQEEQEMSEAEKIVKQREALFSQALQDLQSGNVLEEDSTTIESKTDDNIVTDVFKEITPISIEPNEPLQDHLPNKIISKKTYQANALKSDKLQRLMNLSYRISGKKPKAKFIDPSKTISNQIKLKKPIKRMEDETTIRTMEPVDVAQPESHLVTVTCRPDTKRLVTEVAEELGISPNELLDRGISAVCRMILRNNGRVTFPIEVQQIDLGD